MKARRGQLLRIDAPEWFQRPDFMAWLTGGTRATWHDGSPVANEYSDVFVTFDHGEGSDLDPLMPDDVWQAIIEAAQAQGLDDGIVWIANID